jgi:UDP-sugar transporter A1/2/3
MAIKENSKNRITMKTGILIALCLQNAGYTLVRKYSTVTENVSSKEILFVAEIFKILLATYFTLTDTEMSDAQGTGIAKLIWLVTHSYRMFVLAGIYAAMNILSFVALEYIGAGEFTICAQLKILTTAGFSVVILGTHLTTTKWRALAQLVLGCILVASPNFSASQEKEASMLQLFGYGAVLTEVALSGFASIYFEKVVKSTTEVVTIWERNFQLGIYSLIMYGGFIVFEASDPNRSAWSNWT